MRRSPFKFKQSVWRAVILACLSLGLILTSMVAQSPAAQSPAAQSPAAQLPSAPPVKVESAIEQQLQTARRQGDRQLEAEILSDLGNYYYDRSQYPRAIELYQQAGNIFLQLKQRRSLGQVLINLGNVHVAVGDYEQAQTAYENSLGIAKAEKNRPLQAAALSALGLVSNSQGDDETAIEYLESALKLQQQLNDQNSVAHTMLNLGLIHHIQHDFTQAVAYSQQAHRIAQTINQPTIAVTSLTNLALIYEYQKDYPRSIKHHHQAITIAKSLQRPELTTQVLNNYGYTLWRMGELKQAETTMQQAIGIRESIRSGLNDDTQKISLFDTQLASYKNLQQILIDQNQPEAALEVSEQSRSRAFAEQLDKSPQPIQSITTAQIRNFAKTHHSTLVEYNLITERDFRYRGKQQGRAEGLMIWVVQPDGKITYRQVDLQSRWKNQGEIRQIIRAARCLQPIPNCPPLSRNQPQSPQSIAALNYPGLPELHEILIEPIADLLPKNPDEPVIFIPQDALFMVPFAALPNRQGEYLIQRHTIATAPSIQILNLTRSFERHPWKPDQIVIAGNPAPMPSNLSPLPHAETEARTISQHFKSQPLIGQDLTRSQLLARLPAAKLIHLATHGLLEYGQQRALDIPGAIALAQSPQDSGYLTAMEIAKLKLNADLVVLSACDTGRGTISGDGVLGLARSWITAGARDVVVSLWAVRDESTADQMEQFYAALAKQPQDQPNYAIALRQAMLKTMEKHPTPYDWAAFTLIGS